MGDNMNRKISFILTGLLLSASMAFAQSASQPLGDYARSIRKSKDAPAASQQKKIYDNDTLPATASVSVVGNSAASDQPKNADADSAAASSKTASDKSQKDKAEPQIKPGQSIDERKEAIEAWKAKFDGQNEKIAKASHELELLQREYRVKAAEFYADTARRAQDPTGFAKEDADYKQQIADK